MKKTVIVLLLVLAIATPSYAVNIVDTMLCKPVALRYNNRTILVNRLTGEVKYVMTNGNYVPLAGIFKNQCQALYNAQNGRNNQ